ncbi:MAG: glycosyltransferase family 2 protein [Ferruginibacter sp.]
MKLVITIWNVLQMVIGYNLVMPLVLNLICFFRKTPTDSPSLLNKGEADFAIIVTAYEQTDLLPAVIDSILKINYTNYLVYIVADKCDISMLNFFSNKVILLRPEETLGSNTRSHFYAIRNFKRQHERLAIVDSDNLVHPEFINQLNIFFESNYEAVQGVRMAKNLNTTYACLDAARDIYYHYYDGKLLFNAGSSATLAGSGMAFTTSLYKQCLEHQDITGAGFDKVLQYEIVKNGRRIAFAPNALVFDEKTTNPDQLVKQRSRWINTWFRYFGFGFKLLGIGLVKFDWNNMLFGLTLLRPPLFIFLLLSVFFMAVNIILSPIVAALWLLGILLFIAGFFIALSHAETDQRIYRSLSNIPKFIFYQVKSLIKTRKANSYSVATRHIYTEDIKASQ